LEVFFDNFSYCKIAVLTSMYVELMHVDCTLTSGLKSWSPQAEVARSGS